MRFYVGVTDYDWFQLHASKPNVDEVNFWQPSPDVTFHALQTGEPFLFKLHSPRNYIAGGGFFVKYLQLPLSLAWNAFGEANGTRTLEEARQRIAKYRRTPIQPGEDPKIGCIILDEPFFFPEDAWIPSSAYFHLNIVRGRGFDTEDAKGKALWNEVADRLNALKATMIDAGPAVAAAAESSRYAQPVLVAPRLGQGSFRVLITDAYAGRCAMTQERTLPVLEAAHIRPYSKGGEHHLANGLLLRSDLHTLFDQGYMTIDPDDKRIVVSERIRAEFQNGRDYYQLHGRRIADPRVTAAIPARENLAYHAENVFR